jgi:enoyl-CoA hydratase/carnithine racemase
MSNELILEWPRPDICIMRMNRPRSYNALNRSMLGDMLEAVAAIAQSPARVLVLTASGPGFCAGADLKERRQLSEDERYQHNRLINELANAIVGLPICTIAAINGLAMGGGLELALACDLRFAADDCTIGLTEARVGAIPGAGGTQRLPRLIGAARALELMYSGEPVTAQQAQDWGLVNHAVPPNRLMEAVIDYACVVASRSKLSNAILKEVVLRGLDSDLTAGLEIERQAVIGILKSDDYLEGLAAFEEKRVPTFD